MSSLNVVASVLAASSLTLSRTHFLSFSNYSVDIILSNIGNEHADVLSYLVQKRFQEKISICFSGDELALEQTLDYDSCISNYTIKQIDENNLIVVDDIPSNKNWLDLSSLIHSKRYL